MSDKFNGSRNDNAGNVGLKRVIRVKHWTGKRKIPKLLELS